MFRSVVCTGVCAPHDRLVLEREGAFHFLVSSHSCKTVAPLTSIVSIGFQVGIQSTRYSRFSSVLPRLAKTLRIPPSIFPVLGRLAGSLEGFLEDVLTDLEALGAIVCRFVLNSYR
jgi:hypothetical protein